MKSTIILVVLCVAAVEYGSAAPSRQLTTFFRNIRWHSNLYIKGPSFRVQKRIFTTSLRIAFKTFRLGGLRSLSGEAGAGINEANLLLGSVKALKRKPLTDRSPVALEALRNESDSLTYSLSNMTGFDTATISISADKQTKLDAQIARGRALTVDEAYQLLLLQYQVVYQILTGFADQISDTELTVLIDDSIAEIKLITDKITIKQNTIYYVYSVGNASVALGLPGEDCDATCAAQSLTCDFTGYTAAMDLDAAILIANDFELIPDVALCVNSTATDYDTSPYYNYVDGTCSGFDPAELSGDPSCTSTQLTNEMRRFCMCV